MNEICYEIFVSGKVQGVGFRFFTYQKATELNLTGQAENLIDGRVKIIAQGTKKNIEELVNWLKNGGPKSAKISLINYVEITPDCAFKNFKIR